MLGILILQEFRTKVRTAYDRLQSIEPNNPLLKWYDNGVYLDKFRDSNICKYLDESEGVVSVDYYTQPMQKYADELESAIYEAIKKLGA